MVKWNSPDTGDVDVKKESERAESKAIRELRKKNEQLTVEVRRLRKQLLRVERDALDRTAELEEEPAYQAPAPKVQKPKCPKCHGEDIRTFTLMDRLYYMCDGCNSKGRFNK